jgi:hypothetical protein
MSSPPLHLLSHVRQKENQFAGELSGIMNPRKFKWVQAELPCLGSPAYFKKLPECNEGPLLNYPPTEENAKEILIDIAISLCSHEKNASIWKHQVGESSSSRK